MIESQKKMIENYVNAYNRFDIDGMMFDLDIDVIFENISNGVINLKTIGLEEFREQAEKAKTYFTVRKQSIQSWQHEGSTVTVNINYQAILTSDMPNGLKKGETIQINGKSVFEFENEKIKRIRDIS